MGRDSCAQPLARGDQLKPSDGVRRAELLSEPAELENRGFRPAPSSSFSSAQPADIGSAGKFSNNYRYFILYGPFPWFPFLSFAKHIVLHKFTSMCYMHGDYYSKCVYHRPVQYILFTGKRVAAYKRPNVVSVRTFCYQGYFTVPNVGFLRWWRFSKGFVMYVHQVVLFF